MLALIDGDMFPYRIGAVCESTEIQVFPDGEIDKGPMATFDSRKTYKKWLKENKDCISEEDLWVSERKVAEPVENCLHSVKLQLQAILDALETTEYKIFLTGQNNYRDTLVDYYKANRDRNKRPIHYNAIREYLINVWGAEVIDGMEADDALGISQLEWRLKCIQDRPEYKFETVESLSSTIIVTNDKDLDMIPGWHYNFVKDDKYFMEEQPAFVQFYCQMLEGDTSDNIPGVYKITGKKVSKWAPLFEPLGDMKTEKEMWEHVYLTYCDIFFEYSGVSDDSEERKPIKRVIGKAVKEKLRETGKLLWMKRTPEDDWEPPE